MNQTSRFFPSHTAGADRRSSTPKVPPGFDVTHSHPPPGLPYPPGLSTPGLSTPCSERSRTPAPTSTIIAPAMPLRPVEARSSTPIREIPKTEEVRIRNTNEERGATRSLIIPATPNKPDAISTGSPKPKAAKAKKATQPEEQQNVSQSDGDPAAKIQQERKASTEVKSETAESVGVKVQREPLESKIQAPRTPEPSKVGTPKPKPQKIDLSGTRVGSLGPGPGEAKSTVLDLSPLVSTPQTLSRPTTPVNIVSKDPASIPRPRTIRLTTTSTSKPIEAPLPSANTEKSSSVPAVEALKIDSRRGSIASLSASRSSRPGSPAVSEVHSSSFNISRASSPPPSIIGSAPEKFKSKNQLKKERRAKAAKESLEEGVSSSATSQKGSHPSVTPAEAVGPIVTRQKKKKKEPKEAGSTQAGGAMATTTVDAANDESSAAEAPKNSRQSPIKKPKKTQSKSIEGVEKPEEPVPAGVAVPSKPHSPLPEAPRPYVPTLRDFCEDLKAHAATIKGQDLSSLLADLLDQYISDAPAMLASMFQDGEMDPSSALFNPPPLGSYRLPNAVSMKSSTSRGKEKSSAPPSTNKPSPAYELTFGLQGSFSGQYAPTYPFGTITLTSADRKSLLNGVAVRINDPAQPNDLHRRAMITPRGTVYRHMAAEEEGKALELESRMDDASLLGLYGPDELDEDVVTAAGVDDYGVGNEYGDFENLRGGLDELIRRPASHGIVWFDSGEGSTKRNRRRKADHHPAKQSMRAAADPAFENADMTNASTSQDEYSEEGDSSSSSFGDEDMMTSALPSAASTPAQLRNRTLASNQGFAMDMNTPTVTATTVRENPGPMDIASLISKINSSRADMDALKKEVDVLDKKVQRRGKDVARWRESIMGSIPVTTGQRK